jgi:hypothetical protein
MRSEDYEELRRFAHDTYEHIAKRPSMYAGRVEAIESFVFAVELILDQFGGPDREDKYSVFKTQSQFGNEPLTASFERLNQCRLGFISKTDPPTVLTPEVFQKTFEAHWSNYLDTLTKGKASKAKSD